MDEAQKELIDRLDAIEAVSLEALRRLQNHPEVDSVRIAQAKFHLKLAHTWARKAVTKEGFHEKSGN